VRDAGMDRSSPRSESRKSREVARQKREEPRSDRNSDKCDENPTEPTGRTCAATERGEDSRSAAVTACRHNCNQNKWEPKARAVAEQECGCADRIT
jgi:hypothetical protein